MVTQANAGETPASDCARYTTIQNDSLRVHVLLDEGYHLRATPLPGAAWFDAGDDKTAAELRATVKSRYRKQSKGKRHGDDRTLTLDAVVSLTGTMGGCSCRNL